MPNAVAYLALLLIVPLTAVAYATLRPPVAAATVMIGTILFMPERIGFDAPAMPLLDKRTLTSLISLAAMAATWKRARVRTRRLYRFEAIASVLVLGLFLTVFTNPEPLVHAKGLVVLPGLRPYDAIAETATLVLGTLVPFYLGWLLFREERDLQSLLVLGVLGAAIYIPFIVIELRLSPQLHNWVYGFAQHSFIQTVRGSGYRPMVFMPHGLCVALFVYAALVFAWALSRARRQIFGLPPALFGVVLFILLPILRSAGALIYGLATIPLLLRASTRLQLRVIKAMMIVVLIYPAWRASGHFPAEFLVDTASTWISPERAESLDFRFVNDELLLAHARNKLWFGWGGYARNFVYDEWGQPNVVDGLWIVLMGNGGLVAFIAHFALYIIPVFMACRTISRLPRGPARWMLLGFTWVNAMWTLDCLVNSGVGHLNLFFSGALAGTAVGLRAQATARAKMASLAAFGPRPVGPWWVPPFIPGFRRPPVR